MSRPGLLRSSPLFLAGALLFGVAGCSSDSPTGPPELRQFLVTDPAGAEVDLLTPMDGGAVVASPLFPFKAAFSQLLDGDKIEDVLEGGAVDPRSDVATISWTGAPAGAPAITAQTSYNPAGSIGASMPKPTITIRPTPGLPSGAKLQVKLSRDKVTGKKGAPFTGPDTQMVETEPFSVELSVTDPEVLSTVMLNAKFSNVPGPMLNQRIKLIGAGMPVPFMATADIADLRTVVILPMGGWTVGWTYTVTLGAEVVDLFGVKLAKETSATFTVVQMLGDAGRPASDAGVDAGAAADGGAPADAGGGS